MDSCPAMQCNAISSVICNAIDPTTCFALGPIHHIPLSRTHCHTTFIFFKKKATRSMTV